jgi:aryl-alcohol dehydrogenase-like predicted oxidoreductase
MAMDEGMALTPYGVLNQGRFQTREVFEKRDKDNSEGRNFIPTSDLDKQVSAVLDDLANQRGDGVSLLNIALAYVMQKAPYVFPIIGGRKLEHLLGNLKGFQISLSDEEMHQIDSAYPFRHGFPTDFLSMALCDPKVECKMVAGPQDVKLVMGNVARDWVEPAKPIAAHKG